MHSQSITLPFDDERFWSHVNFDGPIPERYPELGACWLWIGRVNKWGYGEVGRKIDGWFGIGRPNTCLIVNRKSWQHVD